MVPTPPPRYSPRRSTFLNPLFNIVVCFRMKALRADGNAGDPFESLSMLVYLSQSLETAPYEPVWPYANGSAPSAPSRASPRLADQTEAVEIVARGFG